GARPQRLLWASTSTKNPEYRDVMYVEDLIGPDTVNTLPESTLEAFREHGMVRETLIEDVAAATQTLDSLERAGISLERITADLVVDGVQQFSDAFDKLLASVAAKRGRFLGDKFDTQTLAIDKALKGDIDKLGDDWRSTGKLRLLHQRDASLWSGADEDKW